MRTETPGRRGRASRRRGGVGLSRRPRRRAVVVVVVATAGRRRRSSSVVVAVTAVVVVVDVAAVVGVDHVDVVVVVVVATAVVVVGRRPLGSVAGGLRAARAASESLLDDRIGSRGAGSSAADATSDPSDVRRRAGSASARPSRTFHSVLMTPTILPDRGAAVRGRMRGLSCRARATSVTTVARVTHEEDPCSSRSASPTSSTAPCTVYGDRVGVVDEPDQPARVPRRADLRRAGRPGPAAGRAARRARHRRRRPGRGGQPQQRPAADVVLRGRAAPAGCWCR